MSHTDQTQWVDLSDFGPTKGWLGIDPSSKQQWLGDYCLRTTGSISLLSNPTEKAEMGSRFSLTKQFEVYKSLLGHDNAKGVAS